MSFNEQIFQTKPAVFFPLINYRKFVFFFNTKYIKTMIQSMTGYGKATHNFTDRQITVEIKSLNSRQADISTRLPAAYRNKDLILRKLLTEK